MDSPYAGSLKVGKPTLVDVGAANQLLDEVRVSLDHGRPVEIADRLKDLCDSLASASAFADRMVLNCSLSGRGRVRPQAATSITLIVSELVTNAIKHAHPSGVRGRIRVSCRPIAEALLIDVEDDGVGFPEGFQPSSDAGYGLRTAFGLADRIGATLSFSSGPLGLRVSLLAPTLKARPGPRGGATINALAEPWTPGDEGGYRELLDALPVAVYTTDAAGRIDFFNQAAVDLWGRRPRLGDAWCGSWRMHRPDGQPLVLGQGPMALTIKENRAIRGDEAVVERPDGTRVPIIAYPTPIHDRLGRLIGAVNCMIDIGERKTAEDRQKLLAREVHHRTKNLLSVVCSIVSRGMDDDRPVPDTRRIVLGRLFALGATYDNLITTSWAGVDLADIVRTELGPYPSQWVCDGPPLVLNPQAAQNFTLAVHELATNAAKYGALSVPEGRVSLSWSVEDDGEGQRFRFAWRESGGPNVSPPTREGFGSLVLGRVITHDFHSPPRIAFDSEGLDYSLDVSLEAVAAADVEAAPSELAAVQQPV